MIETPCLTCYTFLASCNFSDFQHPHYLMSTESDLFQKCWSLSSVLRFPRDCVSEFHFIFPWQLSQIYFSLVQPKLSPPCFGSITNYRPSMIFSTLAASWDPRTAISGHPTFLQQHHRTLSQSFVLVSFHFILCLIHCISKTHILFQDSILLRLMGINPPADTSWYSHSSNSTQHQTLLWGPLLPHSFCSPSSSNYSAAKVPNLICS